MFQTVVQLQTYRSRTQDRAEVIERPGGLAIVLADGAGGMGGGDEAADTVVMWARSLVTRDPQLPTAAQWCELLAHVDRQVEAQGGMTTAVVASVSDQGVVGASVGDSAAWTVGPEGHVNLTMNQTVKPMLGSGSAKPVPFEHKGFDGTLLVASDGLVKYVPAERICMVAREASLSTAARKLVDLVRLRSGALQDDVAVVLCRPSLQ